MFRMTGALKGPLPPKIRRAAQAVFCRQALAGIGNILRCLKEYAGRRIFIEFDGVMANSDVWINGVHLGKRPYGYVSFGYELTKHLVVSETAKPIS